jgi:CubicO group peptidase (beta-lactamase class C family)
VALGEPVPTEAFCDWQRLCALLAAQEPAWEPGTAHGESALFYGHLVGELVQRADGRGLGRFLREEVCDPRTVSGLAGQVAAVRAPAPRSAS